jgi:protein TonB
MSAVLHSSASRLPMPSRGQLRKFAPLCAIILLHAGFFYALQNGLLHQAVQALPKEVFASFITPEPSPQPEPPKPQPAPPKTVPVVKQLTVPRPVTPVVNPTPSEQAITLPPQPPAPSAPVAAPIAPVAPPVPPAPQPVALPKTISSGVEYLQAPQPEYPSISKRMGEEGKVVLRILINEHGKPERVEVQKSSGSARLDEAGRQAALRALFKPHLEDGKAVAVYAIVPIKFQLD